MNYTPDDYEKAQKLLNDLNDMSANEIANINLDINDLEKVRGLIVKKIDDFKKVIEKSENYLKIINFEDYQKYLVHFLLYL